MASGDVWFDYPGGWGYHRWLRERYAVFLAEVANNYWNVPMATVRKFARYGSIYNCRMRDWKEMGENPRHPVVIPRSFWKRIRKFWPKKPKDFRAGNYYYTTAESLARPKFAWGSNPDEKPWKMIFKVTGVTPTYVYYQGLMWRPPISRSKLPRVIREGTLKTNSAGYQYRVGRLVSRGWKANPFGKFGCEPGYGTSKFSWATIRGWKPDESEEPDVRRSKQADLWRMSGVITYDDRKKLVESKWPKVGQAGATAPYSWYRMPWWKVSMMEQLQLLVEKDKANVPLNVGYRHAMMPTEEENHLSRGLKVLGRALTGPEYQIDTPRHIELMNYPFDESFQVQGKMKIEAFSQVWQLPKPKKKYKLIRNPRTANTAAWRSTGYKIIEE